MPTLGCGAIWLRRFHFDLRLDAYERAKLSLPILKERSTGSLISILVMKYQPAQGSFWISELMI